MDTLAYIIRHGQTVWNASERLQGQADTEINALGRSQADRNGERLADLVEDPQCFDFVASPLTRTRQTMERVRAKLGLPEKGYRTEDLLIEVDFGDWQGSTLAELEAATPGVTAARYRDKWNFLPPGDGAESYEMLRLRVRPWLESVSIPTICVTHGGVIRAIFRIVAGMPEPEAARLDIPQDRILRLSRGKLDWL